MMTLPAQGRAELENPIRELGRHLGREKLESEIVREALDKSRSKN